MPFIAMIVVDQDKVDAAALKALGAKGIIRPSDKALQIVLEPIADQVASVTTCGSRLLIELKDPVKMAEPSLQDCAPRGVVRMAPARWQIIVGPEAQALAERLRT